MLPVFFAPVPVSDIVATFFPIDAMGIVINDCNTPRHDYIVADGNPAVTNDMTSTNERSTPNLDYTFQFFEADIGMNDRLVTNKQAISRNTFDATPSNPRLPAHND